MNYDDRFEDAVEIVLGSEGGYANQKYDRGGKTNRGVTQSTYDWYRSKKGLPKKDIRTITKDEAKQIYYDEYWKGSGAESVPNRAAANVLFDTAVLHGVSAAKNIYNKSGGDVGKMLDQRKNSYKDIVNHDPTQKKFYDGWMNRVNKLEKRVENNGFIPKEKKEIYRDIVGGKSSPNPYGSPSGFAASIEGGETSFAGNHSHPIIDENSHLNTPYFTRESIGRMSQNDFNRYEKLINKQMETVGIPYEEELQEGLSTFGSKLRSFFR